MVEDRMALERSSRLHTTVRAKQSLHAVSSAKNRTEQSALTQRQTSTLLETVREDLFRITTSGTVSGLAIGIPIALFREVADTPDHLEKFGGTPYYLCGHTAMLEMLKAEKYVLRSKDLITFTFDRQQEFEKEMRKVHAHLQTTECEFHSQGVGSGAFDSRTRSCSFRCRLPTHWCMNRGSIWSDC
jgi:hypothetical protein